MKTITLLAITISSFFLMTTAQAHSHYNSDQGFQKQEHRTAAHKYKRQKKHHAYRKGYRDAMQDKHQSRNIRHARPHIETHTYRTYRPHHSLLPVFAGGLIGGVIANDLSYGDPVITGTGIIVGTIIGHEMGH